MTYNDVPKQTNCFACWTSPFLEKVSNHREIRYIRQNTSMSQSVPAYPKSGYTASQRQLLCQFLVTQTNVYVTLLLLDTFLVISDHESVNVG
ncbi:protein of unknown function [Acidithiobacillus ferrivorans]|uniref:Uncharacterized protein n=1 Tax=Acidithiobacillus ferrivorans TaxID=160808 RepID=A0A060UN00_9PROT|nr:hypothetical protein AFERRI_320005 [Acidithiobacillus ferrivorans]SMH65332.1 protein of unknown function [Acidithiobacillus ferrivorans]